MKKKTFLCSLAMASMMLMGCGTQNDGSLAQIGTAVLGEVLGSNQTVNTVGNILGSVLGISTTPTQEQLIGSWTYSQPGCAFTSENLLAKAGGEVAASQIKSKLLPTYQQIGVQSSNTSVTFQKDGTFAAKFAGKSISGNYTYDTKTAKVVMNCTGLLPLTLNGYAKRNTDGIALLFESSKLLTLLQTLSALSGNTSLQTIGELSKNYDGLRLGFDFK